MANDNTGISDGFTEPPKRPAPESHAVRAGSAAPGGGGGSQGAPAATSGGSDYHREPIAAAPFPMDSLTLTELQESRKAMNRVAVLTLGQNLLLGIAIALAFGLYAKGSVE